MVMGVRSAFADARTDSLGLTAGQQIDDLDSIWLYPQDAANFGNVVDSRLGDGIENDLITHPWVGIISQEWSDVGYIGVYTKRPFDMSNTIAPSENIANTYGILNGSFGVAGANNGWMLALNPTAAGVPYKVIATTIGSATYNAVGLPFVALADPENKLDAFWAKSFGDSTFGVHVNYASQSTTINSTTGFVNPPAAGTATSGDTNNGTGVLGLDLGLSMKNSGLFDNLEASVGYSMGSLNHTNQVDQENNGQNGSVDVLNQVEKDNGISEIRLNGLGVSKISDTTNGRLYLNVRLDNLGITSTQTETDLNGAQVNTAGTETTQSNTYTDTNVNLGYALNHKLMDGKAMVVSSLTAIFDDRKWTYSASANAAGSTSDTQLAANSGETEEETSLVIPLNIAVETPLFDWLKGRVGFTKNLLQSVSDKITQPTNLNGAGTQYQTSNVGQETVDAAADVNPFVGVGGSFGNFTLDAQLNIGNLLFAFNNLSPGAGIMYNDNNNDFTTGSQLFGPIAQMDMRYAF